MPVGYVVLLSWRYLKLSKLNESEVFRGFSLYVLNITTTFEVSQSSFSFQKNPSVSIWSWFFIFIYSKEWVLRGSKIIIILLYSLCIRDTGFHLWKHMENSGRRYVWSNEETPNTIFFPISNLSQKWIEFNKQKYQWISFALFLHNNKLI